MSTTLFIRTNRGGGSPAAFLAVRLNPVTSGAAQGSVNFGFSPKGASSAQFPVTFAFTAASPVVSTIQVLPTRVANAVTKAAGNTTQWQAFKSRLDGQLSSYVSGAFEAAEIPWIADFALGYQCLNGSASQATANNYADKAVALLKWVASDYQTGSDVSGWQFLARGDGSTTAFTLADTPTASFQVSVVPVNVLKITRGTPAGTQDQLVTDTGYFLKVSNSLDGSADYARATDWQQNGDYGNNYIDWSPAGAEPAASASYYVTLADLSNSAHLTLAQGAGAGKYQRAGTALTLGTAPLGPRTITDGVFDGSNGFTSATANFTQADVGQWVVCPGVVPTLVGIGSVTNSTTAVLALHSNNPPPASSGNTVLLPGFAVVVQYVYSDGTNAYRQTVNLCGGINNIFIDSAFTARFMLYVACAYDWLYNYSGLDSGAKATLENLLVQWDAWCKNFAAGAMAATGGPTQPAGQNLPYRPAGLNGFHSNYANGYWGMRCAAAAALDGRNSNATQMKTDVLSWRTSYLDANLRNATGDAYSNPFDGTFLGGWNSEGWGDYAPRSNGLVLFGSDVLHDRGILSDMSHEQAWAGEVVKCLCHSIAHPSQPPLSGNGIGTVYAGGDFGEYPAPMPARDWVRVWAATASDANAAAYASYYVQNEGSALTNDAFDLLYRDPNATATNWTGVEPLYYYAQGTGFVASRAAWDYASTYCTLECADGAITGHGTFSPATVMVWRGQDDLLVCATEFVVSESAANKLLHGNLVQVGATGQENLQGAPSHRIFVSVFEGTSAYTYAECDYKESFYTGSSNAATECTRVLLHVRPDYVFVYDRVATGVAGTAKELHWYLSTAPTLTGDQWVTATHGGSKLYGQTYCASALTSAADTPSVAGTPVNRVKVNLSSVTSPVRYASVLQPAASGASGMDASAFVTSGDGKFEGVLIGQVLALFGNTKTSAGATGYQQTPAGMGYTFTAAAGTTTHYVCDLAPNTTFTLTGADQVSATTSANGVLTFTTTGSGSKTVTIT